MKTKKKVHLKSTLAERRETGWFYLLISPWLIGFFALTVYPMGASLVYSFTNWNMFQKWKFVGFANYIRYCRQ